MTLHLPDITLCVFAGNRIALTAAALSDTFAKLSFDRVMIFADKDFDAPAADVVVTPFSSMEDATRIAWREVYPRLTTTHALWMQWDGYPMRPDLWTEAFREYDFIGPVWPWFTTYSVGNTGFSLQSRKLLRAVYEDRSIVLRQPEDINICRIFRPYLEQRHGIRFASEVIADWFGIEHGPAYPKSFGVHGLWNLLYFMNDDEMKARMDMLAPAQWNNERMISTVGLRAMIAGRRELYRWIVQRQTDMKNGAMKVGEKI